MSGAQAHGQGLPWPGRVTPSRNPGACDPISRTCVRTSDHREPGALRDVSRRVEEARRASSDGFGCVGMGISGEEVSEPRRPSRSAKSGYS